MSEEHPRPPLPPFSSDTTMQKARLAEDGGNSRNPHEVALAYTPDCLWPNRAEFLTWKWMRELEYRLVKELLAFSDNRIAVRFAYKWLDDSGDSFRSCGNENWEFDEHGLMRRRIASINYLPISEAYRKFHSPQSRQPDGHPGLTDLGL